MVKLEWVLVSPVPEAPVRVVESVAAHHPGRRIGFLSNRKPNALVIGEEYLRLAKVHGVATETHTYEKAGGPGVAAPPDLLDRIAEECDAVLVGSAD